MKYSLQVNGVWMFISNLGRYSFSSSTLVINNDNNSHCQAQSRNYFNFYVIFDFNTHSHY